MTLDLAELERLAADASRGPWHADDHGDVHSEHKDICVARPDDGRLIAASREAVPALIARVRELDARLLQVAERGVFQEMQVEDLKEENARLRAIADDPRAVEAAARGYHDTVIKDLRVWPNVLRAAVRAVLEEGT